MGETLPAPGRRRFRAGPLRSRVPVAAAVFAAGFACGGEPAPPENRRPVAVGAIPDTTLFEGESFTLNVSEFFDDPDDDPLAYAALSSSAPVATASVSGATLTSRAVAEGTARITVTATDPEGLSATQIFGVAVERPNRAPVVDEEIEDRTLTEGDTIVVDASGTFSDPDGDALVLTAESDDAELAAVAVDGTDVTVAGVAPGSATVSVTATDPEGLSVTDAFDVTVERRNRAPVIADTIPDQTLTEGDTLVLDVADNFEDPDGDPLAYAAEADDTTAIAVAVDGSEVVIAAVAAGTATVSVTATDPGRLSVTQEFGATVQKPNRAPVPVDSIPGVSLFAGEEFTGTVSQYFSDPDGDELAYAAEASDTTVVTVRVSGDTLTVTAAAQGTATITVTATDPGGLSATQTADAQVVNRAPEPVGEIPDRALTRNDTVDIDVSDYFEDPDGDELDYSVSISDTSVAETSLSGSTLAIAALGPGRATVTVTATDPGDLSAVQEFRAGVADPLPLHDLFFVVDTAGDVDTLSQVVLDVAGYFGDGDSAFEYEAETGREEVAEVESVDGTVVTVKPLEVDTTVIDDEVLFDTTTVTVTATDDEGLAVSQETAVRVAPADYEPWALIGIDDQGRIVVLGFALTGCFGIDEFTYDDTVYTVHRSEWQARRGSGWVQLPGTYTELEVCGYEDLPDEPPGTYRFVGEVTVWPADTSETDPGDTVRSLRRADTMIVIEDESRPPPRDRAAASYSAPGSQPARSAAALARPRGYASRRRLFAVP